MDKIAFICEDTFIYWSPVVLAISAFAAACLYMAVYVGKGGKLTAGFVSIPFSAVFGIFLGRIVHWYCRTGSYSSFYSAITDFAHGDFALVGVFLGCLFTAGFLRLIRLSDNLPKMLDAMSIGGCVGIAVGRLASFFNDTSRGMLMPDGTDLPFAYTLTNPVTGAAELRLATFMIQSVAAALIAVALLLYMLINGIRKRKIKDGDICLLFIAAYSISQIVCDSTRYDALVLRSNGFVSMVQIVGLIGLLAVVVIFSVRMLKKTSFKPRYICLWTAAVGLLGIAGYMEYFVQNNGTKALFAYSVMSCSLVALLAIVLIIRFLGNQNRFQSETIQDQNIEENSITLPEIIEDIETVIVDPEQTN